MTPRDALDTAAALAPAYLRAQRLCEDATGDSRLQIPWTLCGFPALALPTGLTPDGLPLAVQFVAARGHEPALLAAACWSEQALGLCLTPAGVRA
jgi:Asp-tRNA(Asn)/Glu-tRNA(Gln) amidotransferase A subunit family amidase